MIKFIHTGDLHLGLQFKKVSFDREKAENRRLELWQTFKRIIDKGIKDRVDFIFIAGDLFEEEYFTLGDMKRTRDILAKASDIEIIITAGNHDTFNKNSLYNKVEWPENITIFSTEGIGKKEFTSKNVVIYGYSWDTGENKKDIFRDFPGVDGEKTNILIIHGDAFSKDSSYLPLDKKLLEELGFDYIGLGHIHKPNIFSKNMAYCGSPEPLDFGETGIHGIIEGKIKDGETDIKLLPFSNRIFLEKELIIDETMGYLEIMDKIRKIDERSELQINLYKIKLEGIVDKDIELNIDDMIKELADNFYYVELIDNTIIDYDLEGLEVENKNNIIGYFIREMKTKNLEDKIIRDALYIGLGVLMKG